MSSYDHHCPRCDSPFQSKKKVQKYCSIECYYSGPVIRSRERSIEFGRRISEKLSGRPKSAEHRKKLSEVRRGKRLGKRPPEVGQKISAALKGKPKSAQHRLNLSLSKGKRKNLRSERDTIEYHHWRDTVIERDHYACQHCDYFNKSGFGLHAHHVLSFSKHPDKRLDVSNGITLCRKCHGIVHRMRWVPSEPVYCACGCKEEMSLYGIMRGSRYKPNHSSRVTTQSPEYREKIGNITRGVKWSETTRQHHQDARIRKAQNILNI
jgi:5-methylcytosine-specific restriction endonuclease McrA